MNVSGFHNVDFFLSQAQMVQVSDNSSLRTADPPMSIPITEFMPAPTTSATPRSEVRANIFCIHNIDFLSHIQMVQVSNDSSPHTADPPMSIPITEPMPAPAAESSEAASQASLSIPAAEALEPPPYMLHDVQTDTIDIPAVNVVNNFFFSTNGLQTARLRSCSFGPALTAALLLYNIPTSLWPDIRRCIREQENFEREHWEAILIDSGIQNDIIPYILAVMDAELLVLV
jgi:hypothetical protein